MLSDSWLPSFSPKSFERIACNFSVSGEMLGLAYTLPLGILYLSNCWSLFDTLGKPTPIVLAQRKTSYKHAPTMVHVIL